MKTRPAPELRTRTTDRTALSWADLLRAAVRDPGSILSAYRAFHEYSLGNQLAAYGQCLSRGMAPGPLGTYRQWQARGRQVKRGEKALWLCVPRTVTAQVPPNNDRVSRVAEKCTDRAAEKWTIYGCITTVVWSLVMLSITDAKAKTADPVCALIFAYPRFIAVCPSTFEKGCAGCTYCPAARLTV